VATTITPTTAPALSSLWDMTSWSYNQVVVDNESSPLCFAGPHPPQVASQIVGVRFGERPKLSWRSVAGHNPSPTGADNA
jgi:hypothetical protein